MGEERRMVSTAEAAEMLGVARGHVRYLARTGRLPEHRISERAVAYDAADVERLYVLKEGRRRLPKRPKG
jgi:excisionase family DNA binding protein